MNRRSFLRGAVGVALAPAAAKLAPLAIVEAAPVTVAMTSANTPQALLSIYYNKVFMQHLHTQLEKMLQMAENPIPEGGQFRNFITYQAGA